MQALFCKAKQALHTAKTHRRTMNKLYVIDGPDKGKSLNLKNNTTTIVRSSNNDIHISDRAVSRYHARFIRRMIKLL